MDLTKLSVKELASLIYETLKKEGIDAVLVGGACVSIYSQNRYQSSDLDFVSYTELKSLEKILAKLKFERVGRSFIHKKCPYLIDFVNPPVSIGHESVRRFKTIKTKIGALQLLSPTDCVKDRLASFFHWDDAQALEQALMVAEGNTIDLKEIKLWAKKEGFPKKYDEFLKKLKQR
jgi:hypothetical protein